ncbi:hypothetical protein AYO22_01225 [Fonsecaea multimorphosa]|nr:hypothetical protein AYO22_01225 [Fonsecaea multimorphosa]
MYLSAVLGLPTFIDLSQVDHVIDLTLEEAIQESTLGFPGREAISLAISAKHLEVMRIVTKAIRTLYPMPTSQDGISKPAGNISISLPRLRQVEDEFAAWSKSASDLLKRADSDASEFCSLRYELEMAFYFARIVLYRPFLHYLARMSDGGSVTQEQSRRALVCIRYASMAIDQSQAMWDRDLLHPASWTSIYTIFLSVVCLMFLIATQKGTKNPIEAWRNADRGIRLLASTSCLEQGSIQCLGVLKQLVRRLSHTVEFDIASIELESPRTCGNDPLIGTLSSNQPGDASAAQTHGTKDEDFAVSQDPTGLYGAQQPWQITGSQLHMQEWPHLDSSDIDEDFSWPTFLYQNPDPSTFGSLSGDLFLQQQTSLVRINTLRHTWSQLSNVCGAFLGGKQKTLENEVVDVPALQLFSWPCDGFADMLNLPHG